MRRQTFQLRDAADIRRLRTHLLTHWEPPRIEVSTDRFPKRHAQRAQDRFAHLADGCNCLIGEVLGGATLLCGTFAVWVFSRSWLRLGLVLVASLGVLLIGKAIELAWTRLRLLLVLRGLRRRLDATQDLKATGTAGLAWTETANRSKLGSSTEGEQEMPLPRSRRRKARRRPRFVLGNAADINRLRLRLATRWTLPRIEIHIDGLAERDVQRAQHRYTRLTDSTSFLLTGVLASLTMLSGLTYVLWQQVPDSDPMEHPELWIAAVDWSNVKPVLFAALCAGLFGWVIERALVRVRLFRVLRGLRRSMPA
jgi:hypothetical protein